jgi:hypothetical protein
VALEGSRVIRKLIAATLVLFSICALAAGNRWASSQTVARRAGEAARASLEAAYEGREVAELQLRLDHTAWAALEQRPRRLVSAQVDFAGTTYSARVRLKGHRSLRKLDEKPAFKLELAVGEGETAIPVTLNNQVEDPSLLREALAYQLMRALGLAAPRTGWVRVQVNGEPYGRYLLVETLDEAFLARQFGPSVGVLYEGEYGCDLSPVDVSGFDLDAGKDPQRARLAKFAQASSDDPRALFAAEGPLDMTNFLTYLASCALVGDFDGYRHSHNYYVYFHADDGKWRFLPWGLDRVFQKQLDVYDSQGLLARRCFDDAACRLEYTRTLARVVARFEALDLPRRARELAQQLDAQAASDAGESRAGRATEHARAKLLAFLGERAAGVRRQLSCIDAAGAELDLDGDGYGCLDCDDHDPSIRPGAAELCDGRDNDCSGLKDDAPACDCQHARLGEREYQLCALPLPWARAEQFCEQKGLVLARIDSAEESRALYRLARDVSAQRWWIGFTDRQEEGQFRWTDGSAGGFTYWTRGQPDNGTCNEDCAALKQGAGGKWHDTHCNQHRPFICGPGARAAGVVR